MAAQPDTTACPTTSIPICVYFFNYWISSSLASGCCIGGKISSTSDLEGGLECGGRGLRFTREEGGDGAVAIGFAWGCYSVLTPMSIPMKDEEHSGSCWAIAAVGAVESNWNINEKERRRLIGRAPWDGKRDNVVGSP
ncbi:hypothetical protein RJ639_023371 [Escallonia herrerae]|uniref:Peptidase C1A papain C-terminal domain-containing protein n=1 Tax=Escallonia herrerae TaxID=1293975 RepID=A0AA88V0N9_9ASTE|nr:hypothetical protein RJ639_023513 [Escallonia herrerae]KAK2999153.1 hypothetical protein RJ639_023371 [Escallonia herrerae]